MIRWNYSLLGQKHRRTKEAVFSMWRPKRKRHLWFVMGFWWEVSVDFSELDFSIPRKFELGTWKLYHPFLAKVSHTPFCFMSMFFQFFYRGAPVILREIGSFKDLIEHIELVSVEIILPGKPLPVGSLPPWSCQSHWFGQSHGDLA